MKYCCESMNNIIKDEGCINADDGVTKGMGWEIMWEEHLHGDSWYEYREIFYCPCCGKELNRGTY